MTPTELPLLCCAPMVRAILADQKTNTRRVIKPQPRLTNHLAQPEWWAWGIHHTCARGISNVLPQYCPYGKPGDRLWVRETWGPCEGGFCYRASEHPEAIPDDGKWHPSIHMPRWASRITLEITKVKVERLQDISHRDALAEGVEYDVSKPDGAPLPRFKKLWGSINSKRPGCSWQDDPWVWVIAFRRVKP